MIRVSKEAKDQVDVEIRRCISVAEKHFNRTFKTPIIDYSLRGTTAGTANYLTNTIRLNGVLLMENTDRFVKRTVAHEFAHIVDGLVHPETRERQFLGWTRSGRPRYTKRDIHGPTWKRIMRLFGAEATRCHTYDTTNAKVREKTKHIYVCTTCSVPMTLGPKRHTKMQAHLKNRTGTYYFNRSCRHHAGYRYEGVKTRVLTTPVKKVSAPATGSKLDQVVNFLRQNPNLSRMEAITSIERLCDMSFAGAQTYYYKGKKLI